MDDNQTYTHTLVTYYEVRRTARLNIPEGLSVRAVEAFLDALLPWIDGGEFGTTAPYKYAPDDEFIAEFIADYYTEDGEPVPTLDALMQIKLAGERDDNLEYNAKIWKADQ